MFTDTHSHIHFQNHFPDVEDVLQRAKLSNVSREIIVGCTVEDSFLALEFVKKHKEFQLWSTLGVHPHNANEWNSQIRDRFLSAVQSEKKIVALGEMGLDYFRNFQPKQIQIQTFTAQLQLAKELDLPVVVHVRDAWEDAFQTLGDVGNTKVILHCFTGNLQQAKYSWEKGYHTSFSGVLTYPKNGYLSEVAKIGPQGQILLETDCPYLTPQPLRGKRNEPAFMVETAKVLAELRGVTLEVIGEQTTSNALKLFGLSKR